MYQQSHKRTYVRGLVPFFLKYREQKLSVDLLKFAVICRPQRYLLNFSILCVFVLFLLWFLFCYFFSHAIETNTLLIWLPAENVLFGSINLLFPLQNAESCDIMVSKSFFQSSSTKFSLQKLKPIYDSFKIGRRMLCFWFRYPLLSIRWFSLSSLARFFFLVCLSYSTNTLQ